MTKMTKSINSVEVISTVLPRWISDFNDLSSELADKGCQVTIHYPRPMQLRGEGWRTAETIARCQKLLHPAVKSRQLPFTGYKIGLTGYVRSAIRALQLTRNKQQLTIIWTILPILLFGPMLRLFNRAVVYQITGLGSVFAKPVKKSLQRRITENIYSFLFVGDNFRIIVHNREDKLFLCDRFSIDCHKIHITGGCGVDPSEFPYHQEYARNLKTVIYSPIRLSVEKGIYDLCKASSLLEQMGVQHEIWFSSGIDPHQSTALSQFDIDEIQRQYSSVRFLNFQPSIVDTLRKSDLVCIPTWYKEGLPTAILEAAASGRALITTDNVGGRDFVRDGIDGRLVEIQNPAALADALLFMISNPEQVESMRQSAHKRFLKSFTKQHMVDIALTACGEIWPYLSDTHDKISSPTSVRNETQQGSIT